MSSELEKLYRDRFSNYSSKTEVDEDALWARINPEEKRKLLLGKKSLLVIGVAVSLSAVASLFSVQYFSEKKNPLKVKTEHHNMQEKYNAIEAKEEDSLNQLILIEQEKRELQEAPGNASFPKTESTETIKGDEHIQNQSSIHTEKHNYNNSEIKNFDEIAEPETQDNNKTYLSETVTDTSLGIIKQIDDQISHDQTIEEENIQPLDSPKIKYVKKPLVVKDTVYKVKRKIRNK